MPVQFLVLFASLFLAAEANVIPIGCPALEKDGRAQARPVKVNFNEAKSCLESIKQGRLDRPSSAVLAMCSTVGLSCARCTRDLTEPAVTLHEAFAKGEYIDLDKKSRSGGPLVLVLDVDNDPRALELFPALTLPGALLVDGSRRVLRSVDLLLGTHVLDLYHGHTAAHARAAPCKDSDVIEEAPPAPIFDSPEVVLSNGQKLPRVGVKIALDVSKESAGTIVEKMVSNGIRMFDISNAYNVKNVNGIRAAFERAGVPRTDLFFILRVKPTKKGGKSAYLKKLRKTITGLGWDYVDLLEAHGPDQMKLAVEARGAGLTRGIAASRTDGTDISVALGIHKPGEFTTAGHHAEGDIASNRPIGTGTIDDDAPVDNVPAEDGAPIQDTPNQEAPIDGAPVDAPGSADSDSTIEPPPEPWTNDALVVVERARGVSLVADLAHLLSHQRHATRGATGKYVLVDVSPRDLAGTTDPLLRTAKESSGAGLVEIVSDWALRNNAAVLFSIDTDLIENGFLDKVKGTIKGKGLDADVSRGLDQAATEETHAGALLHDEL